MRPDFVQPAVGWFTLSLIISGLAQALGRNGLIWWIFGFLGGPIALFVLVLIGRTR